MRSVIRARAGAGAHLGGDDPFLSSVPSARQGPITLHVIVPVRESPRAFLDVRVTVALSPLSSTATDVTSAALNVSVLLSEANSTVISAFERCGNEALVSSTVIENFVVSPNVVEYSMMSD